MDSQNSQNRQDSMDSQNSQDWTGQPLRGSAINGDGLRLLDVLETYREKGIFR